MPARIELGIIGDNVRNIKAVIEYDGTDYFGFQYQPDRPTIQGELQEALNRILGEVVVIYGAGRTDTGVHAVGQTINFRTQSRIPVERLPAAMNSLLPKAISVADAEEVDESFHSRYSARSRLYRYTVLNRANRSAVQARYSWHVAKPLNCGAMRKAAKSLVGVGDFAGFACGDSENCTTVRRLMEVSIRKRGERVEFLVRGNAFLRSMVRVIVGTLVEVGLGLRAPESVAEILRAGDRRLAGKTAPPQGLCLVEVEY